MNRQQKINYVKWWLQRFGNRNDEAFSFEDEGLQASFKYTYQPDGDELLQWHTCEINKVYIHDVPDVEIESAIEKMNNAVLL